MTGSGSALVKKTHPIRGILWGLMFGLGLAIVLIVTTVINLELVQVIIVALIGTAIGVAWGLFGPARQPKGLAPQTATSAPSPQVDEPVGDQTDAATEVDEASPDFEARPAEDAVDEGPHQIG